MFLSEICDPREVIKTQRMLQKNMRREDGYLVRVDLEVSGMEKYICGRKEQDENGFKEKPPSKHK